MLVQLDEVTLGELIRQAVRDELASQRAPSSSTASSRHLTIAEAADQLKCCDRQVRRLIAQGRLRVAKVTPGRGSSRVLVLRASVDTLIASSTI